MFEEEEFGERGVLDKCTDIFRLTTRAVIGSIARFCAKTLFFSFFFSIDIRSTEHNDPLSSLLNIRNNNVESNGSQAASLQ